MAKYILIVNSCACYPDFTIQYNGGKVNSSKLELVWRVASTLNIRFVYRIGPCSRPIVLHPAKAMLGCALPSNSLHKDSMVYQIRKYSKHLLAFVKPESFAASPLQSGHDHINIVVTQAQHGAVRIDAHIR